MRRRSLERLNELTAFTQEKIRQFESGEGDLPTCEELAQKFEYNSAATVSGLLRKRGVSVRGPVLNRMQEVLHYVEDQIEVFKRGEINSLPSCDQIALEFNMKRCNLRSVLNRNSIRLSEYGPKFKVPEPSGDLAWFIGIVSAGGVVDTSNVSIVRAHENILEKYKSIGESLFFVNACTKADPKCSGYVFHSKDMATFLGDLRRTTWAETVLLKHPWILSNSEYEWDFITGFFEKRGKIYIEEAKGHYLIRLATPSRNEATLLSEMLAMVGLTRPTFSFDHSRAKRIVGVQLCNLKDIKLFAENVHSVNHQVEATLEYLKAKQSMVGRATLHSREKFIEEWLYMCKVLGHSPSSVDIDKLRKKREVTICAGAYSKRFGGPTGSFVAAREELDSLLK